MSLEHVAIMNERLAVSPEVAEAIAPLPRTFEIAYRLHNAVADRTALWLMHFGADGAWFSLDPSESAYLTFVGDYWQMIRASRGPGSDEEGETPMETLGDPTVLAAIAEVFALAHKACAVPVSWLEES